MRQAAQRQRGEQQDRKADQRDQQAEPQRPAGDGDREGQDPHRQAGDRVQRVLAQASGSSASACFTATSSARRRLQRHGAILASRVQARYGREVKTLGHAWREFRRKRSPWVIASAIVAALARARSWSATSAGATPWRSPRCSSSTRSASGRSTSTCCTCSRSRSAGGASTCHAAGAPRPPRGAERPRPDPARAARGGGAAAARRARVAARGRRLARCPARCRGPLVTAALTGYVLDRRLRVDPLPDPHRLPPALALLPRGLAHPPPAPLQERALLARDHEHRRRPRAGHESGPGDVPRSRTARTLQSL